MGVSVLGRRRTRRKVKKTCPHESYRLDGEENCSWWYEKEVEWSHPEYL